MSFPVDMRTIRNMNFKYTFQTTGFHSRKFTIYKAVADIKVDKWLLSHHEVAVLIVPEPFSRI